MKLKELKTILIVFIILASALSSIFIPLISFASAEPVYGSLADTVANGWYWEYDTEEGDTPDMIRLGNSEYYAIVSQGDTGTENDGYIRTIRVHNDTGYIEKNIIDYLEYDTQDGIAPSIIKVGKDMYAICYYSDTNNKQTIVTVNIWDENGTVGDAVEDTQQLTNDGVAASRCAMLKMENDVVAVVYSDVNTDLWLETWNITSAGAISAAYADSQEIDTNDGIYPDMCKVDGNTVVVVYDSGTTGSNDGYMCTWNVSQYGTIGAAYGGFWEFDTSKGTTPTIRNIAGQYFMLAYEDTNSDCYVKTLVIDDPGAIVAVFVDTQAIDTTNGDYPYFFNVSVTDIANEWIKGISMSGSGSDVWISCFDVTSAGVITSEIDTLTFGADTIAWYIPSCMIDGNIMLSVYQDASIDGFARTTQVYTNLRPNVTSPWPKSTSTRIQHSPTLSINLTDMAGMENVSWFENSTGSWNNFGNNNSVYAYGEIMNRGLQAYYEFDAQEGDYPDIIRLGESNFYAIACTGDTGTEYDGFIRVVKAWANNGSVLNTVVDSYEYDAADGYYPQIVNVYGDCYAIAYYSDTANVVKVVTTNISSTNGKCAKSIIDSLNMRYDTANTYPIDLIRVTGNVFACAYTNITTQEGLLETFTISNGGAISDARLDFQEFDAVTALHPRMIMVDVDTMAIVSQDAGSLGDICTYNISSAGIIDDAYSHVRTFASTIGTMLDITRVYNNTFAVASENAGNDGWVQTTIIYENGDIGKGTTTFTIDQYEFDKADGGFQRIYSLGNNLFAVFYQGTSADGFIRTFAIDRLGYIGNEFDETQENDIDYCEFDTADCIRYPSVAYMGSDYYLMAYAATGNDGFVRVIKICNDTKINGVVNEPTDSWEFDEQEARLRTLEGVCRINNTDIYICAATGDTGTDQTGVLRTFRIWRNNGTIDKNIIDKFEYLSVVTDYPYVYHIAGGKYVVCYNRPNSGSITGMVSFTVSEEGDIVSVKDRQNGTSVGGYPSFYQFTNNIYMHVAINNSDSMGGYEAWWVGDDGVFNDTRMAFRKFDATFCHMPTIVAVDSDTIIINYVTTSNSGEFTASTWNVTSGGKLSATAINTWAYEVDPYYYNDIKQIGTNIFATFYLGINGYAFCRTFYVGNNGGIRKCFIDTVTWVASSYNSWYIHGFVLYTPTATTGLLGCTTLGKYSGEGDIYFNTWEARSDGTLGNTVNTMEIHGSGASGQTQIIHLNGTRFFAVYNDKVYDGWIKTFTITNQTSKLTKSASWATNTNTKYWWYVTVKDGLNNITSPVYSFTTLFVNTAPTFSSETPTNESTGISLLLVTEGGYLVITVGDVDDSIQDMNLTWRTNESGSWETIGINASVSNGTYRCVEVSWVDTADTKYWWRIYAHDGTTNASTTFWFVTTSGNNPPVLTLYTCYPTTGVQDWTTFYFNVTWTDDDGDDPSDGYLTVNVSRAALDYPIETTATLGGDLDWTTKEDLDLSDYLYYNYTIPQGADNTSTLDIKYGDGSRENLSLTVVFDAKPGVLDEADGLLKTRVYDIGNDVWLGVYYDGAWHDDIWGSAFLGDWMYEEKMVWSTGSSSWYTNQSLGWLSGDNTTGAVFSYDTTLTAGSYYFTFWAYDGIDQASYGAVNQPNVTAQSYQIGVTQSYTPLWFNITSEGHRTQANVPALGQDDVTPALQIENEGNVPIDVSVALNDTLPMGLSVAFDLDNNPVGSTTITNVPQTLLNGLAASTSDNVWLWMDFTNVSPGTGTWFLNLVSTLDT